MQVKIHKFMAGSMWTNKDIFLGVENRNAEANDEIHSGWGTGQELGSEAKSQEK